MSNVIEIKFKEKRLIKEAIQLTDWVDSIFEDKTIDTDGDWCLCECGNWHHKSVYCECEI